MQMFVELQHFPSVIGKASIFWKVPKTEAHRMPAPLRTVGFSTMGLGWYVPKPSHEHSVILAKGTGATRSASALREHWPLPCAQKSG